MSMKTHRAVSWALLACLSVFLFMSSSNAADYKYHWKISTTETPDFVHVVLADKFIKLMEERTGGKVTGEVFSSGQLGNMVEQFDGLEMGSIDVVMDCMSALSVVGPVFDAWGLPYLYKDKAAQIAFWDKNYEKVAAMIAEDSGLRMVTIMDGLNRNTASKKPIRSLADVKGIKMRVPTVNAYIRTWELFGAAAVPMNLSETFTSIQTGVVDGCEFDISLILSMNMQEVAPYIVMTEHCPYESSLFFVDATYQAFPDELKQIIQEVGQEITQSSREMVKNMNDDCLAKFEKLNIEVIYPDLADFRKAVEPIYAEYSNTARYLDLILGK